MEIQEEEQQLTKKQDDRESTKKVEGETENDLPLMALNHASRLCRSVKDSKEFYTEVLGFVETKLLQALDFNGAWLFNYGIGIHLVQSHHETKLPPTADVDQRDPMDTSSVALGMHSPPGLSTPSIYIPAMCLYSKPVYVVYV